MSVTYLMAGVEGCQIEFFWDNSDTEFVYVVTSDSQWRYGEAHFERAKLIECLETVVADLKGN